MLSILRQRNFALLWFGQLISITGDWVLMAALPFYVFTLTGSALATGAMFMVEIVPRLALGSVAGVFVDRWDRRRTMIAADLLRAAILLLLLLVRSAEWLWLVYATAFAESVVSQFFTPAKGAIIPNLVGEGHLVAANSMDGFSDNLARLIGPSLGGVLMAWLGVTGVALLDSASYVLSAAMILLIRLPARPAVQESTPARTRVDWIHVWREWREGLLLVKRNQVLATLFVALGLSYLGDSMLTGLLIPFVSRFFHAGTVEFGWLLTARGFGGLLGGLLIAQSARSVAPAKLMTAGLLILGPMLWVMLQVPVFAAALVLMTVAGLPAMAYVIGAQTLLQSSAPDQFRGRVLGAFSTTGALLSLLGLGSGSALGDLVGVFPLLYAAGALFFLAGGLAWWKLVRGPAAQLQVASSGRQGAATMGSEGE